MQKDKRALYRYLKKYHTGRDNAIICKQLKMRFKVSEEAIRYYVSCLRKDGIPICSCMDGYYYPETHSEIVETVARFNKYLLTLSATNANLLRAKLK
ncbi:uncharacterized protein BN580_00412 [Candidatus Colimorpha enterica]|uniref:Helix-turn-helix type 11 domain-containing protein n=1 Tax=Candidatus Colimorpha enterica TaxID=3083063 RepID=R6V3N8_9BACT|nr:uncharacterized protein BN580_00412 [Candidatus Colimorpha enterica]